MFKTITIALATIATVYLVANNMADPSDLGKTRKQLLIKSEANTQYNYYKYAVEWPGSTCYARTCNYDDLGAAQWNQHGLWPNKWTTWHINGCSKEAFNMDAFTGAEESEIKSFWEGMYSSNEGFWQHEWSKHGTCWNPTLGDLSKMADNVKAPIQNARDSYKAGSALITHYFHTVYEAHNNINFYKALSDNGITPDSDKTRPLSDYVNAFSKSFGVENFDIICMEHDGKTLLNEVRLCVDLEYNVMSCPDAGSRKCKNTDEVYYPVHGKNIAVYE